MRNRGKEVRLQPIELDELLVRFGTLAGRPPLRSDRPADPDQRSRARFELRRVERFADEVVRARRKTLLAVDLAGGHEQHRQILAGTGHEIRREVVPGFFSEHHVHDREVERPVVLRNR